MMVGFVLLLASLCLAQQQRPIIGVVTQASEIGFPHQDDSYIAASYVKFVEAGGARVVPVFYDGSDEYLESVYQQTNGVLFPGGGQHLDQSALLHTAEFFLNKSMASSLAGGNLWPTFGHCQGFEVLLMAIVNLNRSQCMTRDPAFVSENVSLPLTFLPGQSNWFANMSDSIKSTLSTTNATLNNHQWSISLESFSSFQRSTPLKYFRPLTTTVSPGGRRFVSTFEATNAPVWAMQFHAEKPVFEWPNENINHSPDNVAAMLYFASFMGRQARMNSHKFQVPEVEAESLIYNYAPESSIGYSTFEQVYYFMPSGKKRKMSTK